MKIKSKNFPIEKYGPSSGKISSTHVWNPDLTRIEKRKNK
jgi:hypothetical protein